jgi:hypothetical protein
MAGIREVERSLSSNSELTLAPLLLGVMIRASFCNVERGLHEDFGLGSPTMPEVLSVIRHLRLHCIFELQNLK